MEHEPAEVNEDAPVVEVALESPAVVPGPPSVEIVPLSDLDPSTTALEPAVASELASRADRVIVDAAACNTPKAHSGDAGSQSSADGLHISDPPAVDRGPDPPDHMSGIPLGSAGEHFRPSRYRSQPLVALRPQRSPISQRMSWLTSS